jgi:hypothetical protein
MTEEEARRWPDLMTVVEEKVKPSRAQDNRESYRDRWWQYAERRSELQKRLREIDRAVVIARHQPNWGVCLMPSEVVFSEALVVITSPHTTTFSALQSRVHETWARFFGSSLEDRLRYTPSDCFETFPFPADFETNDSLDEAGRSYYEFRADLMIRNNEGLTATYNRLHDPNERSPDIRNLRELHDAMDRAVLDAYGWRDIVPRCEFLLDYEEEEEEESSSRRRKPWRYRWPDDVRDEVLARLLALNLERAEEERLKGSASAARENARSKGAKKRRKKPAQSVSFFDQED